ncbi:MAG: stalk domain-containing protein [Bacillota bacterium]|uniref:Transglutaminase-like domain-containing protein n=1 Tax=Thermanaerosceptrum fracticalcis TaxID=1712410 RepID=A0A7G6E1Z8_THEFR|nr:stalk domain-containing protein [Thermanaerosceptrum fracticalcis]QNB46102.1 hypothetical protein BR63_07115 [Thermanaerosceptrum fracticalcis]
MKKRATIIILIFLLFISLHVQAAELSYSIKDQTYYQVTTTYYFKNVGTSTARDINLAITLPNVYLTKNMPYSHLIATKYSQEPLEITTDLKGNRTGKFNIAAIKPGEKKSLSIQQVYRVGKISFTIDPGKIESYKPLEPALIPYLKPAPGIESDNPLIIKKAKEITGGETNPFLKAKKIFAFLNSHMHYADKPTDPANKGALSALQTGIGVCEDYSDLMVALLRAVGVPSRTVAGWMGTISQPQVTIADESGQKLPGHMWVEYYLPGYGWIPADPTYTYLYNGVPTVDYSRLTGLNELRYAEESEAESYRVYYSYYNGKLEGYFTITLTKSQIPPSYDADREPVTLYLEGLPLIYDVEPVIAGGRTLVPLRGIFSTLGALVSWDEASQTVTARTASKTITLKIGSTNAQINGQNVVLDVPPQIIANRTMVPLRFIGEALGVQVNWDSNIRVINLNF